MNAGKREALPLSALSLLYSQLLSPMPAGLYLSNAHTPTNKPKKAKKSLLKPIAKPNDGIEKVLQTSAMKTEPAGIEKAVEIKTPTYSKPPQAAKFSVAKALKNLYTNLVSYGKKSYEAVKANTKKVVDNVKLTVHKIAKLCEYLLAKTTPQWNMPWGSKFDYDCLSSDMSPQASVSEENKKYQIGYNFLQYAD
jgi:hypothetical protein